MVKEYSKSHLVKEVLENNTKSHLTFHKNKNKQKNSMHFEKDSNKWSMKKKKEEHIKILGT